MNLRCPKCDAVHVDEGEWATRPHKTHQCQSCGHEWRPFEYATVGVAAAPTPSARLSDAEIARKHATAFYSHSDPEHTIPLYLLSTENTEAALAERGRQDAERISALTAKVEELERYTNSLPANWHEDSSLERWFPLTAEELKRVKSERDAYRQAYDLNRDELAHWAGMAGEFKKQHDERIHDISVWTERCLRSEINAETLTTKLAGLKETLREMIADNPPNKFRLADALSALEE